MISRIAKLLRIQQPVMADGGLLWGSGASVPSAARGWQPGALFQDTTNGKLYINEGTLASCTFAVMEALTAAQEALLSATPGVVTASKAVVVDASRNATTFTALGCVNLDAGSSGVAGSVDVFAPTAAKGKLSLSCADQTGDTAVSVVAGAMGQATQVNIADPGAAASYVVQSTAQITLAEADVLDGVSAGTVAVSKAVVVDANKDVSSFRNVGMSGALTITGCAARAIDIVTSGVVRLGVQGTGIPVSTDYPFGVEVQTVTAADIVPGATGLSAGLYSRYEVAVDQTTQCSHVSITGKLRVKADLGDGAHAGVWGYVEISEVGTVIGGTASTTTAAGQFAVEADASFELSTGHLNGVCIDSSVNSGATITGVMAGVRIKKSGAAKAWPVGIQIEGDAVDQGIRVGNWVSGGAITGGVVFTTDANLYADGQLDIVGAYGVSSSDLGSGYSAKVGRFRHMVNSTACAQETYGLVGQVVVKDSTLTHLHAGLMGTFEGHTSGVVANAGYVYGVGAILARVGGGAAITATKDVCGVIAFWNGAALASGASAAFAVGDQGTAPWVNALGVERATNLLDLPAAGTDPVIANALVPAVAPDASTVGADACLRVLVNNVAYYIPLYDTLHA